jgi:hypothetical protein
MRTSHCFTVSNRSGWRLAAATVWVTLTAACTALQPVKPAALNAPSRPKSVVVTRADHTRIVVNQPEVSGDTLTGMANGARQSIPLSDVLSIRAREHDPQRTRNAVVLGLGAVAVVGVVLLNSRNSGKSSGFCFNEYSVPINCCLVNVSNAPDSTSVC